MNVEAYPDAIVSEIFIAAQPEQVFRALTDPEQVPRWWGQDGVYRCTRFDSDLRVGGKWSSSGVGPGGGSFKIAGEYLQVDPPRLLAYTWVASWTGELQTTVCWRLPAKAPGSPSSIAVSPPIPSWPKATKVGRACWDGCKLTWRRAKPSPPARRLSPSRAWPKKRVASGKL